MHGTKSLRGKNYILLSELSSSHKICIVPEITLGFVHDEVSDQNPPLFACRYGKLSCGVDIVWGYNPVGIGKVDGLFHR